MTSTTREQKQTESQFFVLYGSKFDLPRNNCTDVLRAYREYVGSKAVEAGRLFLKSLLKNGLEDAAQAVAMEFWKETSDSLQQLELAKEMQANCKREGNREVWQGVVETLQMEALANAQMKSVG